VRDSLEEARASPIAKCPLAQFPKLFFKVSREGMIKPRLECKSIRFAKLDCTVCHVEFAAQFPVGVAEYTCGQARNKY
jgi:hypothetical protein